MRFVNPYQGIDFSSISRINAISHEHITQSSGGYSLKNAYDRGIRWFASVWYQPAAPRYPYSGWHNTYLTYANTLDDNFELTEAIDQGSISDFEDSNGNIVHTSDLPQIPNAEHPKFAYDKHANPIRIMQHFNVLGNLWSEAGHGIGSDMMAKIQAHPLWDLYDINEKFTSDLLYEGKVFGTINHNNNVSAIKLILDTCPSVFKAMEIFNQGFTKETNQQFRDAYDSILRMGYRIWATSVADWQGFIESSSRPQEYVQECDFDRGCNVLLIQDYENMTVAQKSESGLDAYIAGKFYASGLGRHRITELTASNGLVTFNVDGTPSTIKAITSKRRIIGNGNSISVKIQGGETYIRFEAYYYNDSEDMDFIFTNPIWIEDNPDNDIMKKVFVLGII